jgi:hypothetical protein
MSQALDASLEEFRKLLLKKVANSLFHLSVRLESASLQCLLQWSKDVEDALGEIRPATHVLILMVFATWESALSCTSLHQSFIVVFTQTHCRTRPAFADESPLVDSSLRPKTDSQHADLAWTDVECDTPYFLDFCTSFLWTVVIQVTGALP